MVRELFHGFCAGPSLFGVNSRMWPLSLSERPGSVGLLEYGVESGGEGWRKEIFAEDVIAIVAYLLKVQLFGVKLVCSYVLKLKKSVDRFRTKNPIF